MKHLALSLLCVASLSCVELLEWTENAVAGTPCSLTQPKRELPPPLEHWRVGSGKAKGLCMF